MTVILHDILIELYIKQGPGHYAKFTLKDKINVYKKLQEK